MLYIVLTLTPPNALQAKLNQSKTLQVERSDPHQRRSRRRRWATHRCSMFHMG